MKTILLILFLAVLPALGERGHRNIHLYGNYDDGGYYRSKPVLTIGWTYEFTNGGAEPVSVVVMPGQRLATIAVGQTIRFKAEGEWLLIGSPFERGEKVKGLELKAVLVMPRQIVAAANTCRLLTRSSRESIRRKVSLACSSGASLESVIISALSTCRSTPTNSLFDGTRER